MKGVALSVGGIVEPYVQFGGSYESDFLVQHPRGCHDGSRVQDNALTMLAASSCNAGFNQGATCTHALAPRIHSEHANASTIGIIELAHRTLCVWDVRHATHESAVIIDRNEDFAIKSTGVDVEKFVFVSAESIFFKQVAISLNRDTSKFSTLLGVNQTDEHGVESITDVPIFDLWLRDALANCGLRNSRRN